LKILSIIIINNYYIIKNRFNHLLNLDKFFLGVRVGVGVGGEVVVGLLVWV